MLTPGHSRRLRERRRATCSSTHRRHDARARPREAQGTNCGRGALFSIAAADLHATPGSCRRGVRRVVGHRALSRTKRELMRVLEHLEGQLTATLHLTDEDTALAARLMPTLERKAGRLIANGWPTGVEVSHAMVHGGPYPATSDGRSTSVGTLAIERFLRPVCYQDFPDGIVARGAAPRRASLVPHRLDGDLCASGRSNHDEPDVLLQIETADRCSAVVAATSTTTACARRLDGCSERRTSSRGSRSTTATTLRRRCRRARVDRRTRSISSGCRPRRSPARADRSSRSRAPVSHWHRSHASRLGGRPRQDAQGRGRRHGHRFDAHVHDGRRRRQTGRRRGRRAARMVLQRRRFERRRHRAAALPSPEFALDGSEEPEIAGIYIIDAAGNPRRLGFCLANEFSDHVTERGNYLWLAHSKLRPAALGPELLTGELPRRCARHEPHRCATARRSGRSRSSPAKRTCRTRIANLEHHHFKYALFRRPGDVHVHFFGTATLSFADGIKTSRAMYSRSKRRRSVCRCAIRSARMRGAAASACSRCRSL